MDTQPIANCCPKCQSPLPPDAPQGLCPRCLFAAVATPTEADQPAGHRPAPPALTEIAAAFPQLEILEFIGQGGMGFVFKARQPKLDRLVALKILPQSLAADPSFAERFNREARLLARLSHPGIVTVHDFGVALSEGRAGSPLPAASEDDSKRRARSDAPYQSESQFYYLLMEFVDGVNLRQAMQAGRFTPDQALAIVPKICEALQFAHNEGILHRDIKPENILLDAKGRVKIADFGIAKLVGNDGRADLRVSQAAQQHRPTETNLTEAGKTLGSPNYMAPEQLEHPGEVDHRADIYSLGVVFYEMLTGELPLGRFAPPSQKSAADPRVDEVVLRALEKERERRQHSAGEVRTQVETIASTPSSGSRREEAQTEGEKRKAESEKPGESLVTSAATSQGPRFSRTAIVGACWAAFFAVVLTLYFIQKIFPHGFSGHSLLMAYGIIVIGGIASLLGFTAPFGTTILGWISVSQIRRSAGKLHGLWLAVFDGLLFPLLALDGLIFIAVGLGLWVAGLGWKRTSTPTIPLSYLLFVAVLLGILLLVDWLIIRAVWRVVNKPVGASVQPVQKPDRFWRWFAVAVFAMIAIPFLISIVGLLAAIAIPNFVKARAQAQENARRAAAQMATNQLAAQNLSFGPVVERVVTNPPFTARLPGGGMVELLAVRTYPATNAPWWQPDGAPSKYGADISISDEYHNLVGGGVLALARVTWPHAPADHSFPNGLYNAMKDGHRLPMEECAVLKFEQPLPTTPLATPLFLKVGVGEWQTLTTKKPRTFGNWFARADEREWNFSETAVGVAKVTVDHLLERQDAEYRFVAVDADGHEHPPAVFQTTHTAGDIYSKYEMTFESIGTNAPLLFKNLRAIRLKSRPFQQVEFRNVSLQPGHATTVTVKDFGGQDQATPITSAQPAAVQNPSFGPVVERVVQARQSGTNMFLNLDTGEILTPPPTVVEALTIGNSSHDIESYWQGLDITANTRPAQYLAWLNESGADLMFNGKEEVLTFDGILALAHGTNSAAWDSWDELTPELAQSALEQIGKNIGSANRGVTIVNPIGSPSYTSAKQLYSRYGGPRVNQLTPEQSKMWFFKTREGGTGILQITGFTDNPRGVKIRYKLVQNSTPTNLQ